MAVCYASYVLVSNRMLVRCTERSFNIIPFQSKNHKAEQWRFYHYSRAVKSSWTTSKDVYIYAVKTKERNLFLLEIDVNCLEEYQFCIIAVFKWIA